MTINLKSIFNKAWGVSKHAKNVFGGNASDYFAEALKQSWVSYKATQAREAVEFEKYRQERIASKKLFSNKMSNRDVQDLTVTVDAIEDDVRVDYGKYIDIYFKDEQGNMYDWHTLDSTYTVRKLEEGKEVSISFNFKNQQSAIAEYINYVTAKTLEKIA